MSVKIRMKRMGRKNRAYFRICAADIRAPRDGRVIEELGTYDPSVPEADARVVLNGDRVAYWLSVGAQPSPKVAVLIRKYGKDGSHLAQQQQAVERLGQRRRKAIEAALAAAKELPPPPAPTPEAETSEVEASGAEPSENGEVEAVEAASEGVAE